VAEFLWDSTDVVIRSVDAIAVYRNKDGDVVIRQQSRLGEDDTFIVVPENNLNELIVALQNELPQTHDNSPSFQTSVR
jgi:hypothetical protein